MKTRCHQSSSQTLYQSPNRSFRRARSANALQTALAVAKRELANHARVETFLIQNSAQIAVSTLLNQMGALSCPTEPLFVHRQVEVTSQ